MKSVDAKVYDSHYYQTVCLGSKEFNKSSGKLIHERWKRMLHDLDVRKDYKILDIGCGRGDITLYLAKKASLTVGIDYSKDAIRLAKKIQKKFPQSIQEKSQFYVGNIKKLAY